MTIAFEYGHCVLTCDVCDEAHDEHFENFDDARDYVKSNGWRLSKDKRGNWQNVCPSCQSSRT